METTLLVSVILLNVVLLIVLGFLGFLIYKLLKDRQAPSTPIAGEPSATSKPETNYHPEIQKRLDELKFSKATTENIFCPYHPEEAGEVQCGICHKYFCARCVRPMKSIYFCKEHMALFLRSQWQEVLTLKTSSEDPEAGVRLFEKKQEIFKEKQLPSYVETHYKIDVEGDYIETYLVVFAQEEQIEEMKKLLET